MLGLTLGGMRRPGAAMCPNILQATHPQSSKAAGEHNDTHLQQTFDLWSTIAAPDLEEKVGMEKLPDQSFVA